VLKTHQGGYFHFFKKTFFFLVPTNFFLAETLRENAQIRKLPEWLIRVTRIARVKIDFYFEKENII
jgi:hypothetical protein